jgi:mono/diheme cytochrome c family protein
MKRAQIFGVVVLAAATAWGVSLGTRQASAQEPVMPAAPAMLASQGVYTDVQADRGRNLYDTMCASCHELGRFKAEEFAKTWTDKPLTELAGAVKSMPMDNPGSLMPQEYADILAYFLRLNEYPVGMTELKGDDDAIAAVTLDVKKP